MSLAIAPLNPVAKPVVPAIVSFATNCIQLLGMKLRTPFLALSLLVTVSLQSGAQEWPRFRGENGNGIGRISELPEEFTKAAFDWAVKLDGIGHSSPVLWGKKIFITIFDPEKKSRRVECFDSESGKQIWAWSKTVTEHNLHKHNNFASSTPVATKDAVYLVWGTGEQTEALALSLDGKKIWQRTWPAFSSDHGFGASPIISNGVLILHTDSVMDKKSLVAGLDPKTGETIWEVERITKGADEKHLTAYNTPTVMDVNGSPTVVVFQTNDGWKGLAPATGELMWEYGGDYSLRSVGSITSGDGIVFASVGSGGAGKHATALRPGKGGEPEVLYELGISDGLSYVPTPLIHDGLIYLWGDGGVLTCRQLEDGKEVYRERVGGNFFSSPVIADGKILCGSRDGEFVAVKLGRKFEILGRSPLSSGMNATPAIANNRLFLRTDTHLISIKGR